MEPWQKYSPATWSVATLPSIIARAIAITFEFTRMEVEAPIRPPFSTIHFKNDKLSLLSRVAKKATSLGCRNIEPVLFLVRGSSAPPTLPPPPPPPLPPPSLLPELAVVDAKNAAVPLLAKREEGGEQKGEEEGAEPLLLELVAAPASATPASAARPS